MHPIVDNGQGESQSMHQIVEDLLGERLEALAAWIQELDAQVRAISVAADEKTLKELRRALEAWSKRDPKFEERLTDRIDVLADRLATLSSAVNTTAAAHAGSDGEIASLRRELEQERAKIETALREHGPPTVAGEVDDLRRKIAALSASRPSGKGDSHVDGLRETVENLGERLDTLAKTVATTAAGLAGREGELAYLRRTVEEDGARVDELVASLRRDSDRSDVAELDARLQSLVQNVATANARVLDGQKDTAALRSRFEQASTAFEAILGDLRGSLGALSTQIGSLEESRIDPAALSILERRIGSVDERFGAHDARLDAVAATVAEAAGEVSGRERELAAVQRDLEETNTRVDAVAAEIREALEKQEGILGDLRGSLGALSTQIGGLEESRIDPAALSILERRIESVDERFGAHDVRLDAVAATVAEAAGEVSGRERELAAVQRDLEETNTRVDAVAAEMREALEKLPEPGALDSKLDVRLVPLGAQVEALASRLVEAEAHAFERETHEASRTSELEQVVSDVADRLGALEQARGAASADVVRLSEEAAEERTWVRDQLAALATAAAEDATSGPEPLLADLSGRLGELESDRALLAAEIARAGEASAAERAALQARLEEISSRAAPIPPSEDKELKRLLVAFADRIEAMERDRASIAAETAGAFAAELGQLRVLVGGLRLRLASTEKELAAEAGSGDLFARLEELTSRIDALEGTSQAGPAVTSEPAASEGRYRLEHRALELRMEHAEAAAREHREAVLVQLERLASRIEWRLQRLESVEQGSLDEEPAEADALGRVVPIRGGAET